MRLAVITDDGVDVLPTELELFRLDGPRGQTFIITVADFLGQLADTVYAKEEE